MAESPSVRSMQGFQGRLIETAGDGFKVDGKAPLPNGGLEALAAGGVVTDDGGIAIGDGALRQPGDRPGALIDGRTWQVSGEESQFP